MHAGLQVAWFGAARELDGDFIDGGEVLVEREGYTRSRHSFTINGEWLADLSWRGRRRAFYRNERKRYEISVGPLQKLVRIISDDGKESQLIERSRTRQRARRLRIEMAEGANFCLFEKASRGPRQPATILVRKPFETLVLVECSYQIQERTQTTVRITIKPGMKGEERYLHRIMALITCWIILQRRRSGLKPHRIKEQERPGPKRTQ